MLEEATRYCELVESDGEVSPEDLRDGLLLALTDLLVVAYRLQDAEPDDGEEVPGVAHGARNGFQAPQMRPTGIACGLMAGSS